MTYLIKDGRKCRYTKVNCWTFLFKVGKIKAKWKNNLNFRNSLLIKRYTMYES